jgi:hypothetical protein
MENHQLVSLLYVSVRFVHWSCATEILPALFSFPPSAHVKKAHLGFFNLTYVVSTCCSLLTAAGVNSARSPEDSIC